MVEDGQLAANVPSTPVDAKPEMHVKVYSPFRVYLDSQAYSVSGENTTGPFDILPHHHPFISLLNACELKIDVVDSDAVTIRISGGIMHVKADKATVFLQV